MHLGKQARRLLSLCLVVLGLVMAMGPSSAMAEVAAKFSPENQFIQWSGSVKVFKNGGSEKTCTFPTEPPPSLVGSNQFFISEMTLSCTGGTSMRWDPKGSAWFGTSYSLKFEDNQSQFGFHEGPWMPWAGEQVKNLPWTNGSGLTPSHISFNKTRIGINEDGSVVTATGTVNVTTSTGGLLVLTH